MDRLLLMLHLLVCIALVAVVLVQSGKGGGLAGGAFGGSAQTVFGGRGATDFFTRATMVLGIAFFLTSVGMALITKNPAGPARSIVQQEAEKAAKSPAPGPTRPTGQPAPSAVPQQPAPAPAPAPGGGGK